MALATSYFCWYCEKVIYTINNNSSFHDKSCDRNPKNCRNANSSLTEWEFEEFMKKSIEWKKNEDKKDQN